MKKASPTLYRLEGGGSVLDQCQVPGCMQLESEGEVTAEHFPTSNNVQMKRQPLSFRTGGTPALFPARVHWSEI
jgi:hypothetical protein